MSLYDSTAYGEIYHDDCAAIMPALKKYDLLLTDPPYGLGKRNNYHRNHLSRGKLVKSTDYGQYDWDNNRPSQEVMSMLLGSAKNQVIWGGNYFADMLPASSCWLVWDKLNSGCFADAELAWTSFSTAVRLAKIKWAGMFKYDMKFPEKRYHPTQKPIPLFEWVIDKYSDKGETVFDCYAGSGTTALAAIKMGRKYVLIEREEKYCEIAAKRVRNELQQSDIFRLDSSFRWNDKVGMEDAQQ